MYERHERDIPYTVYHKKVECYQVPQKYTTYRPVYTNHVVEVPVTSYTTMLEPCEKVVKTIKCEPVMFEQHICVQTGDWKTEQIYVPGPVVDALPSRARQLGVRSMHLLLQVLSRPCGDMPGAAARPLVLQENVLPA